MIRSRMNSSDAVPLSDSVALRQSMQRTPEEHCRQIALPQYLQSNRRRGFGLPRLCRFMVTRRTNSRRKSGKETRGGMPKNERPQSDVPSALPFTEGRKSAVQNRSGE